MASIARQAGLPIEETIPAMRRFNKGRGEDLVSDRTIKNAGERGFFMQTHSRSIQFVREFIARHASHRSPAETTEALSRLVEERGPADVVADAGIAPELLAFCTRLMGYPQADTSLAGLRTRLKGHYKAYRKTTDPKNDHYYEEPFFFADQGDGSWMLQADGKIARGFSTTSTGVGTTVFTYPHDDRLMGISMLMMREHARTRGAYLSGMVLRFSDTENRPSATRLLLAKENDKDIQSIWANAAKSPGDEHDNTRRILAGTEIHTFLEHFGLGTHAKAQHDSDWNNIWDVIDRLTDE